MIKLNFEFDSKDSVSSRVYNWLSSFPLDQGHIKVTTSVDYIDPETNKAHRIGNMILDAAPDEAPSSPSVSSPQKIDELKDNVPKDQVKTDRTEQPEGDRNEAAVQPAAEPPLMPKPTLSFDTVFESSFDESILAAVAFMDVDTPDDKEDKKDEDGNKPKDRDVVKDRTDQDASKADQPEAAVVSTENSEAQKKEPAPAAPEPKKTAVSVNDDRGSEDYDFLLNSLDEFNA